MKKGLWTLFALIMGLVLAENVALAERVMLAPYADIRYIEEFPDCSTRVYHEDEYREEDIVTFTFNADTVLEGNEELAAKTLEDGKNPGLGVRALHERGITGEGVNVAIIDQNLLLDHPEFSGKIAAYLDTGCDMPSDIGSMHAPAVTSILVGESIGVAPGARVYFAAVPSWLKDSAYFAKALDWIVAENEKLPEGEKIRLVSVSAAPSGEGSPYTENTQMWVEAVQAAQEAGILVIDCRSGEKTCFVGPAYFDPQDRDAVSLCKGGFPDSTGRMPADRIGAPVSYRTVAEEYVADKPSYQYDAHGGLSWGVPYVAGLLALGWQVNPELSNEEIVRILFDTAFVDNEGNRVVNPPAFIEAIEGGL